MLAGFIAILWLLPFEAISMTIQLPFDLHFDRIVLPAIVVPWLLALVLGGPGSPRLHLTAIHGAIALFVSLAFLSVALDIGHLNEILELKLAMKHLVLLVSYVALFVMLASVVRRTEVPAFLTYILILGVVCALGALWEYRFHYNVFYVWSAKLLPGIFHVQQIDSSAVDDIGRAVIRGPAENSLEAAAMLSMALALALVAFLHARRPKARFWYGVATCIVFSADVATYRKTAFVAPAIVLLTIGFFRRRELLRFAPLGVVMIVAIHALSPGALGSVLQQFDGSRLTNVNTTWHRSIAYEAMRPDVFSHLVLGAGYGSYDQFQNRILDSQVLDTLVEMGVVGLAAYLLMAVSVVLSAVPLIRSRDPTFAPAALALAAAAVAFLTASFLSDAMALPHLPYIFLTFAALVAVLAKSRGEPPPTAVDRR
jgi:hypothetical protein